MPCKPCLALVCFLVKKLDLLLNWDRELRDDVTKFAVAILMVQNVKVGISQFIERFTHFCCIYCENSLL